MEKSKMKTKSISQKLCAIQVSLKAKKSRWNGFGKYNYRSAEDILEALKVHLNKEGCSLTIMEELTEVGNTVVMCSTATLSDGTNELFANAIVGVDFEQRGMNMPQKFGSASSYAKKYALGNLFLIDDTADSDATNDHSKGLVSATVKAEKIDLKLDSAAFTKALEYIVKGGDISAIKKKYNVSKEVEAKLA
jgi:hypothetical protein